MSEEAYMDATRFPLTTQNGLTVHLQKLIDAVNLDNLKQWQEEGNPLNPDQQQLLAELEAKCQP